MGLQTYDENTPLLGSLQIDENSGTTPQCLPVDTEPAHYRIDAILASTNSTTDVELLFSVSNGFVGSLGRVTVPAGSGIVSGAPVDVMAALPTPVQGGIVLPAGAWIWVAPDDTLASTKYVLLTYMGGLM